MKEKADLKGHKNKRIDVLLALHFKDFSRSFLQKYIEKVGVGVGGRLVKKSRYILREEEDISLPTVEDLEKFLASSAIESGNSGAALDENLILHSEKDFVVIDKPPFVTTEEISAEFFPVHRLDKDTSGVLMLARNSVVKAGLQRQWQARTVEKTYIALVKGRLEPMAGAIEGSIFRSIKNRQRMALSAAKNAREAYTGYKVVRYFNAAHGEFTLLRLFPKTGRTHQIRVHCAGIGHPIIGDSTYGDKKLNEHFSEEFGLERQFLHATELKLNHPKTNKRISFKSKLPRDLDGVLEKLKSLKP